MTVKILHGDVRAMLAGLEADSVQCVVTSPPYYGLRDYGVDGQIGHEPTPAEFVAELVAVFAEVRRVLRPDGVCWLNMGDSYAGSGKGPTGKRGIGDQAARQGFHGQHIERSVPAKNLLLIPWRLTIALQDDGWYVRSVVAWCKTSAMPESVQDRPTSAWEPIIMLTKSARYYYDADAVRQPVSKAPANDPRVGTERAFDYDGAASRFGNVGAARTQARGVVGSADGANLRNWWPLGPEPSRAQHYAAFPTEIPRRCILASTSERGQCPSCGSPWARVVETGERAQSANGSTPRPGIIAVHGGAGSTSVLRDGKIASRTVTGWAPTCQCDAGDPVPQTVLDPFVGTGTTVLVADRLQRHGIGIELNAEYAEMARRRVHDSAPMFADVELVKGSYS